MASDRNSFLKQRAQRSKQCRRSGGVTLDFFFLKEVGTEERRGEEERVEWESGGSEENCFFVAREECWKRAEKNKR